MLLWTTVVKRSDNFAIAIFTWRNIVSMASPTTDIAGENVMCRDQQIHMRLILFIFFPVRERVEFNKSCNLIGSWSGAEFSHMDRYSGQNPSS